MTLFVLLFLKIKHMLTFFLSPLMVGSESEFFFGFGSIKKFRILSDSDSDLQHCSLLSQTYFPIRIIVSFSLPIRITAHTDFPIRITVSHSLSFPHYLSHTHFPSYITCLALTFLPTLLSHTKFPTYITG
jgi:hypothetical protein